MAYRGSLGLNPFIAEIKRLDTAATKAADGYDDTFKTVKTRYDSSGRRSHARIEMPSLFLKCQVEVYGPIDRLRMGQNGNLPQSNLALVFHMQELESRNLVNVETGEPLIRVNDRLVALYTIANVLKQTFPDPPGMYATHVQPRAFGIGGDRNLLVIEFNDRPQGLPQ